MADRKSQDDTTGRAYRRLARKAEDAFFFAVLIASALLFAWFIEVVVLG